MDIARRRFIKLASLTTASLTFLRWNPATAQASNAIGAMPADDALFNMFGNPKNFHHPL